MTFHALVDESARNNKYLVCAVLIEPKHLNQVRKKLNSLLLPAKNEEKARQRCLGRLRARCRSAARTEACNRQQRPS